LQPKQALMPVKGGKASAIAVKLPSHRWHGLR